MRPGARPTFTPAVLPTATAFAASSAFRHGQRWDILMENFVDRHRLPDAQAIADVAQYVSLLDDPTLPGMARLDHDAIVRVADYLSRFSSLHTDEPHTPNPQVPRT